MFKSLKLLFAFVQSLLRSMLNISSALERTTDELDNLADDWQETNLIHRKANRVKAKAKANRRLQKALSTISADVESVSKQSKETNNLSSLQGEEMTPEKMDSLIN